MTSRSISTILIRTLALSILGGSPAATTPLVAQEAAWTNETLDPTVLSLEELLAIRITSVSRRPESIIDAAAAVSVISGREIEGIGATTLASALRLAPGVQVGRIDTFNNAVSARGFNDVSANKLLVLLDGRTIYNQLFSGVLWNYTPVFLADLQQIEVIRGPGATLWSANAVNGVINVTSKSSRDTLGGLLAVSHGDEYSNVEARYGWRNGDDITSRIYVRWDKSGDHGITFGQGSDGWDSILAGARIDGTTGADADWMLMFESRDVDVGNLTGIPSITTPYFTNIAETGTRSGLTGIMRWTQPIGSKGGEWSAQMFVDHSQHTDVAFGEKRTIFDLDTQAYWPLGQRHEVVAGLGYRVDRDDLTSTAVYTFPQEKFSAESFNVFIQDEISLHPETLHLIAGSKFEYTNTVHWEVQPSLRLSWQPSTNQRVWAAVSRAARTPARSERNVRIFSSISPPSPTVPLPTAVYINGNPQFDSEDLVAYELGYRARVTPNLSLDAAVFLNRYTGIRHVIPVGSSTLFTPTPHIAVETLAVNAIDGTTTGAEVSLNWHPLPSLQFNSSISVIDYDLEAPAIPGIVDSTQAIAGTTPRFEVKFHATWSINEHLSLNLFLDHRDELPASQIPAYTGLDARLAWRPNDRWEVALTGQDLLDPSHAEFPATFLGGPVRELARTVFLTTQLRF